MPQSPTQIHTDTPRIQNIPGGTCPLTPMQICLLWSARHVKIISPLAFRVYFASHEVKYWRATPRATGYHYEPYGFNLTDVSRLLPGVPETKITKAFGELQTINILNINDQGIWFAESLNDVNIDERIKQRVLVMFNQLHENTRDKIIKIPRRLLRIIVQCGKQIVRIATLFGMLLTTILTKRTNQYQGYKGCSKAEWIGKLFSVNAKRVNSERAKLINEGWFTREPTTPRVRKKWGEWVRLNLTPTPPDLNGSNPKKSISESAIEALDTGELTIEEPLDEASIVAIPDVEEPTVDEPLLEIPIVEVVNAEVIIEELTYEPSTYEDVDPAVSSLTTEVQPQNPPHQTEVQPLLNLSLSPYGEIEDNQELSPVTLKPGAYQPQPIEKTTWKNIRLNDLECDTQSEALRQEAIQLGYLKNTEPDRINFFSSIAHALRVAKANPCGLLRTIVEKNLWHVISQADEYNGIQRIRRLTQQTAPTRPAHPTPVRATHTERQHEQVTLSQDATIVQTITADLNRAGIKNNILNTVQRHGHLKDWNQQRWLKAEQEILQARLLWARQRYQATIPAIGDLVEESFDDD